MKKNPGRARFAEPLPSRTPLRDGAARQRLRRPASFSRCASRCALRRKVKPGGEQLKQLQQLKQYKQLNKYLQNNVLRSVFFVYLLRHI